MKKIAYKINKNTVSIEIPKSMLGKITNKFLFVDKNHDVIEICKKDNKVFVPKMSSIAECFESHHE